MQRLKHEDKSFWANSKRSKNLSAQQGQNLLIELHSFVRKQDRETRSMAVPEVTIYNLLKPQAFSFECLYLKKTTGNLSIYVPQK